MPSFIHSIICTAYVIVYSIWYVRLLTGITGYGRYGDGCYMGGAVILIFTYNLVSYYYRYIYIYMCVCVCIGQ